MNVFAFNMIMLGIWAFAFRKHLDPKDGGSVWFLVIVALQMLLIMLYSPLVSDAVNYETYASDHFYGNAEPGWVLFSEFVWSVWPDGKALVFSTGLVILTSFSFFAWRNSRNMALSVFVFVAFGFWGMSFYVLRQSIALAVILFAYDAIKRGRRIIFLLLVLLAAQFHQTAFIFLVLFPFLQIKRSALYHIVSILTAALLFLLCPVVVEFLFSIFRNGDLYEITELSGVGYFSMLVLLQLFLSLCDKSESDMVMKHSLQIGTVLQVVSFSFSTFVRAIQYFAVSATVLIPNSFAKITDRRLRMLVTVCCVAVLSIYYFAITECAFPGGAEAYVVTSPWR